MFGQLEFNILPTKQKKMVVKRTVDEVANAEYPTTKVQKSIIEIPSDVYNVIAEFLHDQYIYSLMQTCKAAFAGCQNLLHSEFTINRIRGALKYQKDDYVLKGLKNCTHHGIEKGLVSLIIELAAHETIKNEDIMNFIDGLGEKRQSTVLRDIAAHNRSWKPKRFEILKHYNLPVTQHLYSKVINKMLQYDGYVAEMVRNNVDLARLPYIYHVNRSRVNSMFTNYGVFMSYILSEFDYQFETAVEDMILSHIEALLKLRADHPSLANYKIDDFYTRIKKSDATAFVLDLMYKHGMLAFGDQKLKDMLVEHEDYIVIALKYNADQLYGMKFDVVGHLFSMSQFSDETLKLVITDHRYTPSNNEIIDHLRKALKLDSGIGNILMLRFEYAEIVQNIFGAK